MPKDLIVNPAEVRRSETLDLGQIPVNAYAKTLKDELASNPSLNPTRCIRIYRDMVMIREFETMLDQIKKLGEYEDLRYNHAGPAHLSIGQEAAAVGQCIHLHVHDHLFGSHRSHGEILAKGLRAVDDLHGTPLRAIMSDYFGGSILRVVEPGTNETGPLKVGAFASPVEEELGIDFLLYGLLAEIFGRETGFNKGMGGSMHAFFIPFGVYPNNALVGGSADIATGAALY